MPGFTTPQVSTQTSLKLELKTLADAVILNLPGSPTAFSEEEIADKLDDIARRWRETITTEKP